MGVCFSTTHICCLFVVCCFFDYYAVWLQALLQQHLEGRELAAEIIKLLLHITHLSLMWQQHAALAARDQGAATALAQRRAVFMRVLDSLLDDPSGGEGGNAQTGVEADDVQIIRSLTFRVLMDLILVGGSSKFEGTVLEPHRLLPSQALMTKCWSYCMEVLNREVPDDEDDEDDELQGKRAGGR